jgi:hypothetical protein
MHRFLLRSKPHPEGRLAGLARWLRGRVSDIEKIEAYPVNAHAGLREIGGTHGAD